MDKDDLQQMADRSSDAQAAAGCHINAVPYASSTAPPSEEDDITAINHAPAPARQPLVRQQPKPWPQPRQQQTSGRFADGLCYFHARRPPPIVAAPGGSPTFFLHDPITGIRFLMDTGAG
ncbi:hypothetical protein E2C01_043767 [Portunus trituberculatus]|uniref:Peptidase A2 domain-containing protein n=1 Tax=Portunus trituberculatus TaxID=210409 RepID=A0A5B7FTT9_PORTR|nr:hypothetical protein [Portunus trituberculatus]